MKSQDAKQFTEQAIAQLTEQLAAGQSETLERFLKALSHFHRYSWQNTLLIACQAPDATHVAGFQTWRKVGRYVRKGEKGILIIAPMVYRRKAEAELDEGDSEGRSIRGFRGVHVFDVTQTEGEPLPDLPTASGDPGENLFRLKEAVSAHGITLHYEKLSAGTYGLSQGGEITIATELSPAHEFSVLVHEFAHELLHKGEDRLETNKTQRETEAEAVAYVVLTACGMEPGTAASDYIQLYRGTPERLTESLERIQRAVAQILPAVKTVPQFVTA
jgi:antirestriction protein ArdC